MSVIVQSRDKEPVPNWIRARLLHIRRSLLRRFTNMSVLRPSSITVHPSLQPLLQKTYWNLLSGTDRNVILFSNTFYGVSRTSIGMPRTIINTRRFRLSVGLLPPRDRECL